MKISDLKIKAELYKNYFLSNSYAPHPRDVIFIDPTGLCNLGCKFCAYPKLKPGFTMKMDLFDKIVHESTEMGFENFFLTPMLGDAFMDKTIIDKLDRLENHSKVKAFSFYTNLVLAKEIKKMGAYNKMKQFDLSIYGINKEDFELVTTKGEKQFDKFLDNLRELKDLINSNQFYPKVHCSIRTKVDSDMLNLSQKDKIEYMLDKDGEVIEILNEIRNKVRISVATVTDSWLGVVKQEHVSELGLKVEEAGPMLGPCVLIFGAIQIRYDGTVHACTRSVANKLQIGDINKNKLSSILSLKNDSYKSLIDSHLKNDFPDVCKGCAHYRSSYQNFKSGAGNYGKKLNVKEVLNLLQN